MSFNRVCGPYIYIYVYIFKMLVGDPIIVFVLHVISPVALG